MLRKIDRVIVRVTSVPAAVAYYRDMLGMKLIRQEAQLASFRLDDHQTELVLHSDPDLPGEAIYYLVDDLRDLYRRREALRLTFTGPPTRVSRGYRATVKDPFGNVLLLLDRVKDAAGDSIETAKVAGTLFAGVESKLPIKRDALVRYYEMIGRTADDLPYTPHFESFYKSYSSEYGDDPPSRQEVWRHLLNVRKSGDLPKLGDARSTPPDVSPEALEQLREMLGRDLGKRDRLPYTARFDKLVDQFNKNQQRPFSPHLVWRMVASMAK